MNWQDILVGLLFLTVISSWIYRRFFRISSKGRAGCGCEKCDLSAKKQR
ncbi:FeoB-associated Cys-rich membrane protein [Lunatimonas salinarum]